MNFLRVRSSLRKRDNSGMSAGDITLASNASVDVNAVGGMPLQGSSGSILTPGRAVLRRNPSAASDISFTESLEVALDDIDDGNKSVSYAHATMQACSLFVFLEGNAISPVTLRRVMGNRTKRAKLRKFGLQALNEALQLPDVTADPFCLVELLSFIVPAMSSLSGSEGITKIYP